MRNFKTFFRAFLIVFILGICVTLLFRHSSYTVRKKAAFNSLSGDVFSQGAGYSFATPEKLTEHYQKHGWEFSYNNEQEYLYGARKLITGGEGVLTFARANGDMLFYHPGSNEFAVLNARGIIRTYFRPSSGIEYWNRQITKR